jgi:hypothetical protein
MEKLNNLFRFDIDQTLNDPKDLVRVHMLFYNEALDLRMTQHEIVNAARAYRKTFDVPQIIEYRAKNEDGFQEARDNVRKSLKSNMEFAVNPGAVEGVQRLASVSPKKIGYATVRPYVSGMERVTKQWLRESGFPEYESVEICENPTDKLVKVITAAGHARLPVVLVDDNMGGKDGLLKAATDFPPSELQKLTLVGYGMDTQTAQSLREESGLTANVEVIGLKSWQASLVSGLIGQLAA